LVWEIHARGRFYRCELLDHGQWGIESQVFRDNDLLSGQRFPTKREALTLAESERVRLSK
jgi:hypothetical protein